MEIHERKAKKMKKIKKLGVVAIVIAMCALLGITVWATDANATSFSYTVEASKTELCVNDNVQTVTVTLQADRAHAVNSLDATIVATGCTVKSVTMPAATETDFVDYDETTGRFGWVGLDSENQNTQTLLTIVIEIPAMTEAGECTLEVKDVILTQLTEGTETEFAMITLTSKTATASVTVKVNEHVYVAGDYTWTGTKGNTACTVLGTCECGAETTATATVASKVETPATCEAMGDTTYTATFKETWAQKQTKTVEDIDKLEHVYTGAVQSNGNGKDATHSFMCINGCQQYGGAVAHTWDEGKVTTNPGCTSLGVKTYTCEQDKCGATYTEEVAANGHTFGETTAAQGATCLEAGNDAYKQCTECGKFFAADAAVDSTEGKDSADAFTIEKKDHSYTGDIKNDGDTHSFQCVNGCNAYGNATDHDFTEGDCECGAKKPVAAGLKGDVNLDGKVDALDLDIMVRYVPGLTSISDPQALINADVNEDGKIDAIDLDKFVRFVPGLITDWNAD